MNRNDHIKRGDILDLLHEARDYRKAAPPEYSALVEAVRDMPGREEENPIISQENQDMWETYRFYTHPIREATEEEKKEDWYKAYMGKRVELEKLIRLDDGNYVFKEWLKQYKGRTYKDIGMEMRVAKGQDPDVFFPEGVVYSEIKDWIKANGEYDEGPYIATMEYFATGEGISYRVIASHAESLAHFILHCGKVLGGSYFVQGCNFFRSLKEAKKDQIFERFVPESAYGLFATDCYVNIDLKYHMNCS